MYLDHEMDRLVAALFFFAGISGFDKDVLTSKIEETDEMGRRPELDALGGTKVFRAILLKRVA